MDSLSFLQGIFPTRESNWGLPHCRQILYQLSYQESPYTYMVTSNVRAELTPSLPGSSTHAAPRPRCMPQGGVEV